MSWRWAGFGCRQLLTPLIKSRTGEWTLRFGRGWLKPLWHFLLLWHEGHDGCGGRAQYIQGLTVFSFLFLSCACSRRMCGLWWGLFVSVHSHVIHSDGPLELKGQPCCRAIKASRSVSSSVDTAFPTWHYKYTILRGKSPSSLRCDHTSSLGGLCWLMGRGVRAKYSTDMIS